VTAHIQADTPTDAFWTLDPFALVKPNDPWFVDLERLLPREHYGVSHKLRRHLGPSPTRPEFVHVGLMGHVGMGKTTLARNALVELSRDGLSPVYIDSRQAFDQSDFTFSDLVLVLVESVIRHIEQLGLDAGKAELETVRLWFAEELLTETHSKQIMGSMGTTAEGGISIPFLANIAAKFTSLLKSNNEYRQEIRKRADRDPPELIRRANLLLDTVHKALEPRGVKLCVVFDNLEKMQLELVDKALLQRAEEFAQLRTNTLLFFNPMSEYSPLSIQVTKVFSCINVPALPVRFPGDAPDVVRPEALHAIEHLLHRRLVLPSVFENPPACIRALAHWSGGHLRDLLQIAKRAIENVEPAKITVADVEKAGRWLGGRRTSSLQPADLARAVEIHRTHRILDTDQDRRMLKNSCVLPYDGTEWWDVHPGVRSDTLFLEALAAVPSGS
jgi:hypothetical protein